MVEEHTEAVEKHRIHEQLENVQSTASSVLEAGNNNLDNEHLLRQLIEIAREIERRLKVTDPLFIPIQALDPISQSLDVVVQSLTNLQANWAQPEAIKAFRNAHEALRRSFGIQPSLDDESLSQLRESIVNTRRSLAQHASQIDKADEELAESVEEITQEIQGLENRVQALSEQVSTKLSEFSESFSDSQETRRSEFDELQREISEEANQQKAQIEATFDGLKEDIEDSLHQKLDEHQETLESQKNEFSESATSIIGALTKQKEEAGEIVGIIGLTGMVHGYQSSANSHKRGAAFWRITALASLVGLVGSVLTLVLPKGLGSGDIEWIDVATRALLSVTFGFLASYSGLQAKFHAEQERRYRRFELAIATLDPFLREVDSGKTEQIKEEPARLLFGIGENEAEKKHSSGTPPDA